MAAGAPFINCLVCYKQLRFPGDPYASDTTISKWMREQGWQVPPAMCPVHKGLRGAAVIDQADIDREQCTLPHDPQALVYHAGLQMAQVVFSSGSRDAKERFISPRGDFCQIHSHYWRSRITLDIALAVKKEGRRAERTNLGS
jgi:hypothetical protein